ncbi:hypothetical protein PENSPDRAFT_657737 [Peniophora sp. CONT]|nr:hypothetical protein PENSPDRAFT_657737 [Peniophora sp. CONT]
MQTICVVLIHASVNAQRRRRPRSHRERRCPPRRPHLPLHLPPPPVLRSLSTSEPQY